MDANTLSALKVYRLIKILRLDGFIVNNKRFTQKDLAKIILAI